MMAPRFVGEGNVRPAKNDSPRSSVSSDEVGKAILPFLQDLDEIAYLRFASVYHAFNSLDDFARAIDTLRQRSQEKAQASKARG